MPGKVALEKKQQEVNELVEKLKKSKTILLADYRGITVEQVTKLRNDLRAAKVEYRVIKNNLIRLAAKECDLSDLDPYLAGPTALLLSYEDYTAPAKIILNTAKEVKTLNVKGGWVDGTIIDANGVKDLAEIPSKEVLIARVLGGLNSPIAGFVNVLNGPIRGLCVALNAIAQKQA